MMGTSRVEFRPIVGIIAVPSLLKLRGNGGCIHRYDASLYDARECNLLGHFRIST